MAATEPAPEFVPPRGTRFQFRLDPDRSSVRDSTLHHATFDRLIESDRGRYYLLVYFAVPYESSTLARRLRFLALRVAASQGSGRFRAEAFAFRRTTPTFPTTLDESKMRWLGQMDLVVQSD